MKKILLFIIIALIAISQLHAQGVRVSGVIRDESGTLLPGVTVIEKGSQNGTTTNTEGKFSLSVREGAVLQISIIGYKKEEVKAIQTMFDIKLMPQAIDVDEVVVVGYGIQKKASVVGAISTVTSAELKQMGTSNLSTALAGKVAGITFSTPSGRPGGDNADIFIRGVSTLNRENSKPLILVDGVERDYSQIDPNDIETFSVLKDASATAVYGVRGANGVVLITTKRGEDGPAKVGLTYKFSLQQPTRLPTFLGSYDHALLRNESLKNDNAGDAFFPTDIEHYRLGDAPYTHPDNNYINDFVRKLTPMHDLNLNVRGGSDKVKYYVSLNGMYQDGIYKQFSGRYPSNANFQKINLRSNLDFSLTKTTLLSLDLNARLNQQQNISGDNVGGTSLFTMMYETPPMSYPYRLPDGSYGANKDGQQDNILAALSDWGYIRLADNILEGTVKLRQKLDFVTKGLSFNAMASFNSYYDAGSKVYYRPPTYLYVDENTKTLIGEESIPTLTSPGAKGHRRRTNMEVALNYNRTFDDHAVSGMLIYTQTQAFTNANVPNGFLGYSGRATYAYRDKYLFEANFGYNGSDQFEKSKRYGFFPSFSLGYVLSEEEFIKNKMPAITFLKLRGSYGKVGNDKIGSDRFLYLQTYEYDKNEQYYFGVDGNYSGSMALYEGAAGNSNVTWEVGTKYNLGVDLRLFNNLAINFDLFQEDRDNIFIARNTTPATFGIGTAKENLGKVKNQGFELEMGYNSKIGTKGSWYVKGMYSMSKNTIIYSDEVTPKYEYLRRTGKSVGQIFGHTVLRYYTPDDFVPNPQEPSKQMLKPELPQPQYPVQPGDFMYWDRNGDQVIDLFDEGDIGNSSLPRFVYNFSYGFNYRNVDFYMMWQGAGGNNKMLSKAAAYEPVRENNRFLEIHKYRWTEERWRNGEQILYPRLSSTTNKHNHVNNTYYMKKGDYLRLKSIEIGYTFNKKHLKLLGLNSLRVYVGGSNLFTFDHIKNYDPEMGEGTGYFYPQMKLWNAGINIQF